MDLLKKNIHMDCSKADAITQITLEDDKNIPDSKPDVNSINLEKAEVLIDEIKPGNDMVHLKGRLHYHILYHTLEEGSSLIPFEGDIPFEEKLSMPDVVSTDSVSADGEVEDFSVDIINSRKLSIRSLVTLSARVEELYDETVPVDIRGDEALEYRKMPLQIAQVAICKNDIYRIKDEVSLPPSHSNIFQILWHSIRLADVEFKIMEEKLGIRGDLHLFVLYEGEGENHPIQSFEATVPFSGVLDCHGCREGMLPDIHCAIGQQEISVRPDLDGEERCIGLELTLDISVHVYAEETVDMLCDVYGVKKEVSVLTHKADLMRVLSCVTGKTKVTDHVRVDSGNDSVMQILHSEATVCQEHHSVVENGILLTGSVQIKIMYVTGNDENPYAGVRAQLPYHYTLEIPGIAAEGMGKIHAEVEQLQVTMLDGEELDVKAVLCFSTMAFQKVPMELIDQIQVRELDSTVLSNLPGMVIYIVKEGDNLWNIGKKYYVPTGKLRELNNLNGDELKVGQKLLIAKGF